jgi:predicted regulator of Ras-like GTPase activity (Roadblock/LC7/MglB family)
MNDEVRATPLDALYVLDGNHNGVWASVIVGDEGAFIEQVVEVTYSNWRDKIRELAVSLAQELGGYVTIIRRNPVLVLH